MTTLTLNPHHDSLQYLVHRGYTKAAAALVSEAPGISVRRASDGILLCPPIQTFTTSVGCMQVGDSALRNETHHVHRSTYTLVSRSMQ